MSTRSTWAFGEGWHLFTDLLDGRLWLDSGGQCAEVPRAAAEAIAEQWAGREREVDGEGMSAPAPPDNRLDP